MRLLSVYHYILWRHLQPPQTDVYCPSRSTQIFDFFSELVVDPRRVFCPAAVAVIQFADIHKDTRRPCIGPACDKRQCCGTVTQKYSRITSNHPQAAAVIETQDRLAAVRAQLWGIAIWLSLLRHGKEQNRFGGRSGAWRVGWTALALVDAASPAIAVEIDAPPRTALYGPYMGGDPACVHRRTQQ